MEEDQSLTPPSTKLYVRIDPRSILLVLYYSCMYQKKDTVHNGIWKAVRRASDCPYDHSSQLLRKTKKSTRKNPAKRNHSQVPTRIPHGDTFGQHSVREPYIPCYTM